MFKAIDNGSGLFPVDQMQDADKKRAEQQQTLAHQQWLSLEHTQEVTQHIQDKIAEYDKRIADLAFGTDSNALMLRQSAIAKKIWEDVLSFMQNNVPDSNHQHQQQ